MKVSGTHDDGAAVRLWVLEDPGDTSDSIFFALSMGDVLVSALKRGECRVDGFIMRNLFR